MRDLRLCIVGAGQLATRRIFPYIGAAGAELVGVCDLVRAKAECNTRRFGGVAYDDMHVMLAETQPDGVIICIGPEQHAQLAPIVMRNKIPVYTEAPPAPSAAAALEVASIAQETGILCTTAFKKRYCIAYNQAKEWLAKYPPEDFCAISICYALGQQAVNPHGGYMLHAALHVIDLVGFLFGDIHEVFAFSKGFGAYAVSLRFSNDAVGTLDLNCRRSTKIPTEEVEITVEGGHFMTIHNSSSWRIVEDEKAVGWREPPIATSAGDSGNETGHLAEIVDFLAAIREHRSTRSNIYESYKSMVVYEAIKASTESGKVVQVSYQQL